MNSGVPKHLGLILDGNRRWARAASMPQLEGHRRGYDNFKTITEAAIDRGVEFVSVFAFSTENWDRSKEEVDYLMDLVLFATREIDKLAKKDIKAVFLGSKKGLSKRVLDAMAKAEEKTKNGKRGAVAICLNYGGHTEIAEGVARLVADGVKPEDVTEELLGQYLYHPEIPPLDLVIRTSGEMRISNFMLWRLAYAELYFTSVQWPAFTVEDLDAAIAEYKSRQRRFGK